MTARLITLLTAVLALTQVSAQTATHPLDGEWNIITVNQVAAQGDTPPYIGILTAQERLYGSAGCNRIIGTVSVDSSRPDAVCFPSVGSTRLLCPNRGTESDVLQALRNTRSYTLRNNLLTLSDSTSRIILTLTPRPVSRITALEGTWVISEVNGEDVSFIEKTTQTPTLTFNPAPMTFSGCTGCNSIEGDINGNTSTTHTISFTNILTTTALCADSKLEAQIIDALNRTQHFTLTDSLNAALTDVNGSPTLTLIKGSDPR